MQTVLPTTSNLMKDIELAPQTKIVRLWRPTSIRGILSFFEIEIKGGGRGDDSQTDRQTFAHLTSDGYKLNFEVEEDGTELGRGLSSFQSSFF